MTVIYCIPGIYMISSKLTLGRTSILLEAVFDTNVCLFCIVFGDTHTNANVKHFYQEQFPSLFLVELNYMAIYQ